MVKHVDKFGLLATTVFQLGLLERVVNAAGQRVEVKLQALSKNLELVRQAEVDTWLVQLNFQNGENDRAFMDELEAQSKSVIYADLGNIVGQDFDEKSFNRLTRKVSGRARDIDDMPEGTTRAKEVWVLAASLGGPEAVAEFLNALQGDCKDVAFLYVQHISAGFEDSLQTMVKRNCSLKVFDSDKPRLLATGCIYIVSPQHQIELNDSGWMTPVPSPWRGCYQPSIDQVVAKVARRYGAMSGAIIFSGMGDDGSGSCSFMKHSGGRIWAQEPSSCIVDSMPKEAISSKGVSFTATPAKLAASFEKRHSMAVN